MAENHRGRWKGFHAAFSFVAAIIGAGIFGLPYTVASFGLIPGIAAIIFFCFLFIALYLMYGEMALRTEGVHNIAGYAEIYLGEKGQILGAILNLLWLWGMLFVYLLIGGEFVQNLLGVLGWHVGIPTSRIIILVFLLAGLFGGAKFIMKFDFVLFLLFVASLLVLALIGLPYVSSENIFRHDFTRVLEPWGMLIFAFFGFSAFQFSLEILKGEEYRLKSAIIWGTGISAVFFIIFTAVIVGITGLETSPDALSGLKGINPHFIRLDETTALSRMIRIVYAFMFAERSLLIVIERFARAMGTFSISEATAIYSNSLRVFFVNDCHLKKIIAVLITVLMFVSVIVADITNFVPLMKIIGAAVQGRLIILILCLYYEARKKGTRTPEYALNIPTPVLVGFGGFFVCGSGLALFWQAKSFFGF